MTYSWHEDFYNNKVKPSLDRNMQLERGLFAWVETTDKQAYDELARLEQVVNDLWGHDSDHDAFKKACQEWYAALITARDKWFAAMRGEPVPEKQDRLF